MKKATSLLLVLTMVFSLLSGCGKPAAQESTPQVPATAPIAETAATAEHTTEPTTEPTLSPEELLYNSLTDRQRQAVDVGIVELSQMEDLERIATIGEASTMLQKAYVHRTGVESKMLKELMTREEYASRNADRGWLMGMPGLADLELTHGEKYENVKNMKTRPYHKGTAPFSFPEFSSHVDQKLRIGRSSVQIITGIWIHFPKCS